MKKIQLINIKKGKLQGQELNNYNKINNIT